MKEDILEQMVDEYLQHKGYFTQHNLKFRPTKDHTDYIDRAARGRPVVDVGGTGDHQPEFLLSAGRARYFPWTDLVARPRVAKRRDPLHTLS